MRKKRRKSIVLSEQDPLAIFDGKNSERIITHANQGMNKPDTWWRTTYRLRENGLLWGIYQTSTGNLRRTLM